MPLLKQHMKAVKIILYYLGISNGITGIWALFFPQKFYSSFPGMGLHWIDITGPYNEHFIVDIGASFLAMAFLSLYAVINLNDGKVRLACLANLVFAIPHLIYHLQMSHMFMTPVDKVLGIFPLVLGAILPALVLVLIRQGNKR